jgi:hypothetical protein
LPHDVRRGSRDLRSAFDPHVAAKLFTNFPLQGIGRKFHEIDTPARRSPTLEGIIIIEHLDGKHAIVSACDPDGDHPNGFDGAPSRAAGSLP